MKKISMLVLLACVGVAATSLVWADHHEGEHKGSEHHDSGWFDSAACEVCKPWHENQTLMMSTKWETHLIKNGMLMVTVVPKDQLEAFEQVCNQCKANGEKIAASGNPAATCGFCSAMGELMQSGVKMEEVKTEFGKISLMTSDKPETVSEIHKVAKRSQEEAQKMAAAMKVQK